MYPISWYVGIDWGSESHAVCLIDATGHRREERRVTHTADAVRACLDWIVQSTGAIPGQIGVAIETPGRPDRRLFGERLPRVRRQPEAARSLS